MKVRSNPEEFTLFRSNTVFIVALCFGLAIGGLFLAYGKDYLYDNGKLLYSLTLVGFTALVVAAFLRLQLRVASLANELRRTCEEEEFERNRTLTLINSIKDAVVLVDESGHIALYNAATLDLLDTNVSISRQPVASIFKPEDGSAFNIEKTMEELKGSKEVEFVNISTDGKKAKLNLMISRARSGYGKIGIRGFVFVIKRSSGSDEDSEEAHLRRHGLRNSWAVVEGSIENALAMLGTDNTDGAKKALENAAKESTKLKGKIL
jgi:signal transduction histidine kinase